MLHQSRRGIGRNAKNLIMLAGLITFVQAILWYFLPIYFENVLADMFLVGTAISGFSMASLLVSLPAGDIIDRVGRRFTFILGILGFILSVFLLFAGEFIFLFFFMFFFGAFTQICQSAADTSLMDNCTKKNVGWVMGIADGFTQAGWAFGPITAAGFLIFLNAPFFISVTILLLVAISIFSLRHFPGKWKFGFKEIKKSEKVLIKDKIYFGEVKRVEKIGKPLIAILLFFFALGFWEYAIWTFEPIWTNAVGAGLMLGAVILAMASLPYVLFSPVAGRLVTRLSKNKMLAIGAAFAFLGQAIFIYERSLLSLALCFIFTALGVAFLAIPLDVYVKKHVRSSLYGELFGADEMAYEVGGVVAPISVGVIAMQSEMTGIIWVSSALFVCAIIAMFLLFRKD